MLWLWRSNEGNLATPLLQFETPTRLLTAIPLSPTDTGWYLKMATLAPIVINDAQATPVAHTFAIGSRLGNKVTFVDRSPGILTGFKKIEFSFREATNSNAGARMVLKIMDPTLAVTAPASGSGVQPNPVVAYTNLTEISTLLPSASSLQSRKDQWAYLKGIFNNAMIQDAFENYAFPT